MIWSKIHDNTLLIGVFLGGVALGALSQSAVDKSPKLPWLHQQAAVANKLETVTIPKLASVAGCQEKRADIAEGSIGAANTSTGLLPCPDVTQALKKPETVKTVQK